MSRTYFTTIRRYIDESKGGDQAARRLLPASCTVLHEAIASRLPAGFKTELMPGYAYNVPRKSLCLGVGIYNDTAAVCMLFYPGQSRHVLHIANLECPTVGRGDGSRLMLHAMPAVLDVLKVTHTSLEATDLGLPYWVRLHQQMTPESRAAWQAERAIPFADMHEAQMDPDTAMLLRSPGTSTAVLAALKDPDPRGLCRDLGTALFIDGPDYDCLTRMTPLNRTAMMRALQLKSAPKAKRLMQVAAPQAQAPVRAAG